MNIGFDFDKIFIDYPPFIPDRVINRIYKQKDNGVLLYRIPASPEQLLRKLTHLPFFRPAITDNLAFVRDLAKQNGNNLFLISGRFGFLQKQTEKLKQKHKLHEIFSTMHFNFNNEQPHIFKNKLIKKYHIAIYIDDDLSLLKFLAKENPTSHFYWLNKKNQANLQKNLFAITHLSQAFKNRKS